MEGDTGGTCHVSVSVRGAVHPWGAELQPLQRALLASTPVNLGGGTSWVHAGFGI